MKKRFPLTLALAIVTATSLPAQTTKTETDIVIKAKVTLLDGSHFFGTPYFSSLMLTMDFGKLEIPVTKVASLDFIKNKSKVGTYSIVKDSVKIGFDNKDILSGTLGGTSLDFGTIFNDVRLEPTQIKSISFSKQRDLSRSANEPGLLLHAPLDMEQSALDLFGARMDAQKVRIVEGPSGNAMLLDSPDAKVTIHLPFSPHALPEGAIEFWARFPQPRQRFSGIGGQPWFFTVDDPDTNKRHFAFGFTANDGTGKGGLIGRIHGVSAAGTHYAGSISTIAETGLLRDTPDEWHHYAIIWKLDGVDFPDARGKAIVLTVDGRIVAVADKNTNDTVRQTAADGFRLIIRDGKADSARPVAMSDLKIWNYAKFPDDL